MGTPQWDRRQDALGNFNMLSDDVLCTILGMLPPRDVGTLACVSSVFYIFCNEEPLWMQLCLEKHEGGLDYKGTWRQTALEKLGLIKSSAEYFKKPRHFEGFSSMFLYRRWYRCHVALDSFALDKGAVERKRGLMPEEFTAIYDGKKPVLLADLMTDWPANERWRLDELAKSCGDAAFKVSQPHGKSIDMTMKDYAQYMSIQHDEEPLYIFDAQFGESAPELLKDYKVPALFSEDLFSVLGDSHRPPFRWFVLGPARSGASWHVDPSLTSAWNSLVSGRKRWALYPPGKVPPGVLLDVDEDDGSVHYDGPTSLQWWLDVYPHLEEENKPLECTQLPGETIYVPSGWWHCVLNIDDSVAVTQNFVNPINLEIVCMDLSPGYRHRAIARAGVVALEGRSLIPENGRAVGREAHPIFTHVEATPLGPTEPVVKKTVNGKNKNSSHEKPGADIVGGVTDENLLLALKSLKIHSDEHVDPAAWHLSEGKNMGGSMMREWLRRLWVDRPELQPIVWKGACIAIDAGVWLQRIKIICKALSLPVPTKEEQLPIGDGSNPVYLVGEYVIKIYIQEGGPDASIEGLGSELNLYALLKESGSSLQQVIPEFVASGILYPVGDNYKAVSWDGTGDCSLVYKKDMPAGKKRHRDSIKNANLRVRTKWSANSNALKVLNSTGCESGDEEEEIKLWPYLITKRCEGTNLSEVIHDMADDDLQSLASYLGEKVKLLHILPLPNCTLESDANEMPINVEQSKSEDRNGRQSKGPKRDHITRPDAKSSSMSNGTASPAPDLFNGGSTLTNDKSAHVEVPKEWQLFVSFMRKQRETLMERLREWDTLPEVLMNKVEAYIPADPVALLGDLQVHNGRACIFRPPVWLHNDLMADNILVESARLEPVTLSSNGSHGQLTKASPDVRNRQNLKASYILDFGDLLHGDALYEFLPIHIDIFHLKKDLMETCLKSYGLPLCNKLGVRTAQFSEGSEGVQQFRLSYCAMCYCLLHELDEMSTIFRLRKDLRTATSFEDIEETVWGFLNEYSCENNST
ncbi:histone arginine demethylase JMJD6 [Marchantia polymorpha subsp. ruderalis]|uniref:JmjC domain-containing protein n=2 Tax=Marchantia polymorpha TaxID=3197 RepID=A0AAF6BFG3_MARPO|nr:hypothetical protein MARPO_0027s0020 [Marchantia polymorpha]BBN10747.1 hypothetical protein Mp_5g06080 [Marchantia polymorpha subsp. ruderalis]|eukprot:PTQ42887.1 hypothetical protein MARPO_0027s0020 [Marchantia polymorpha]